MKRSVFILMTALCGAATVLGQVELPPSTIVNPNQAEPTGELEAPPADEEQLRAIMTTGNGSVAVQAIQGTPNGPAIGAAPVEIILYHRGQVVHSVNAELDEHGVVVVEGLPVAMEVTPVVQVNYGGVFYRMTGPNMSPQSNHAKIEVTVYETTDERPEWRITMRHIMVQKDVDGLVVSEMIVLNNPATQTWLGDVVDDPSPEAKRPAAQFQIAHGATDVQLTGGFHGWCCTSLDDHGHMAVAMPMMPGKAEYRLMYRLPLSGSQAAVRVSAPVPTDHLIALIGDDGSTVTAENMTDAGSQNSDNGSFRMFEASSLDPDQLAGLSFTGLKSAATLEAATIAEGNIKWIAAVGGGVILLAGIVVVLFKSPKRTQAT